MSGHVLAAGQAMAEGPRGRAWRRGRGAGHGRGARLLLAEAKTKFVDVNSASHFAPPPPLNHFHFFPEEKYSDVGRGTTGSDLRDYYYQLCTQAAQQFVRHLRIAA